MYVLCAEERAPASPQPGRGYRCCVDPLVLVSSYRFVWTPGPPGRFDRATRFPADRVAERGPRAALSARLGGGPGGFFPGRSCSFFGVQGTVPFSREQGASPSEAEAELVWWF